ncbi:MAG: tRNA-dihydrouridine synthase family protein [Planctomycetaceae bacterium]|nr:tRNA-dihydrouridine synthase family protein [Planctomycetaceae bacterium]
MNIGKLHLSVPITLAPMEEHTSFPFRLLMKRFGAGLVCTERIDAADVARRDRRALRMLYTTTEERPRAAQISGAEPAVMAAAARVVEEHGFDLVDLNFECPIRRLMARGEGGALMADPAAVERIVAEVARAVSIGVTLKLRSGPDLEHETAAEIAQRAQDAGAVAIVVHARSVAQAYVGDADWDVVSRVKQAVNVPVLGSGGIREAGDVVHRLRESGADGVAIGRGCLGNPWVFRQSRALLAGNSAGPPPTRAERGRALLQLVEGEFRYYGRAVAIRRLARTSCYFAKSLPDFNEFRGAVHRVRDLAGFRRLVSEYFR